MNFRNASKILCNLLILAGLLLTACGGAGESVKPPYIRVVSGDVQAGGAGALNTAQDNTQLAADSQVKTGADGRAVLSFLDGSTLELEPGSEVALGKGNGIAVTLVTGTVWAAANTETVSVDAGGPVASAKNAGFSVSRTASDVAVTSVGSTVSFAAGGSTVQVPSGQESKSQGGAAPSAPAAIEVKNAMRIILTGEALVYVADPSGRGLGYHPTKEIPVNQMPNGWYVGKAGRPQVVSVPNITEGEYTVLLVAANNQSAWKIKIGFAGSDLNFTEAETSSSITWGTPTGITVKVKMDENGTPQAEISPIWTLYVDPPGKVALGEELKRKTITAGVTAPTWTKMP